MFAPSKKPPLAPVTRGSQAPSTSAEKNPNNASIRRLQGRVLRALRRFDEAEVVFRAVIDMKRDAPTSYRELALTQLAQRKTDEALGTLRRGYEATAGSLLVTADLAQLYGALGEHEKAISLYETFVAANPESEPANNNLAMVLVGTRTDQKSLDTAARLAERFRDSKGPGYLDTLGWVHHKRGEASAAVSILEEVVALSPNVPTFEYHLGGALIGAGKKQQGKERLEKALAMKRPFAELREATAMLEALNNG